MKAEPPQPKAEPPASKAEPPAPKAEPPKSSSRATRMKWLGAVGALAVALGGLGVIRGGFGPSAESPSPRAGSATPDAGTQAGAAAGPRFALEGIALDDYERPVEGAVVEALRFGDAAPESLATGATDSQGTFRLGDLPEGRYEVRARKPGYSDEALHDISVPSSITLKIKLERSGVLRGRVAHGDGSPAPGSLVMLRGSGATNPPTATTDAEGNFELSDLPAGIYGLDAQLSTGLADLVSKPAEGIELQAGAEAWVMLELETSEALRGAITDRATGRPIPAATVTPEPDGLSRPTQPIASDLSGQFSIPGLRGRVARILAQAPGYVPQLGLGIPGGNPLAIALDRAAVLSGIVVDEAGDPVAGADLEVIVQSVRLAESASETPAGLPSGSLTFASESLGVTVGAVPKIPIEGGVIPLSMLGIASGASSGGLGGGAAQAFRSAADGRFRITPVAPGKLFVVARHAAFTPGQSAAFEVAPGASRDGLEIQLGSGGLLQGEVLDADERPAMGIPIELMLQPSAGAAETPLKLTPLKLTTVSDRDGRFELGPVRGTGVVIAHPPGEPPVQTEVVIEGPQDVPVVLRLTGESGRILGDIAGASGEPLVAAVVRVTVPDATPPLARTAVTDTYGSFEIGGLPKAPCQVDVEHPEHVPLSVEVLPSDEPVHLQLASGARLRAQIVDRASGDPVAGATVSISVLVPGAAPSRRRAANPVVGRGRSNRLGVVEIHSLNPDNYSLNIEHPSYTPARFEAGIEASSEPTDLGALELDAAVSASGQVIDRYGSTVVGAQVAAGEPPAWRSAARTGKDGSFRIKGLPAGAITLTARGLGGEESEPVFAQALAGEEADGLVLHLPTDGSEEEPSEAEERKEKASQEGAGPKTQATDPQEANPEANDESASGPSFAEGVAVALSYAAGQVRVQRVLGQGARKAGLREGDVVHAVDGERVLAVSQARSLLRGPAGKAARLELGRDGNRVAVRVPRERFTPE